MDMVISSEIPALIPRSSVFTDTRIAVKGKLFYR